ncbi:hypothetical protein IGI04_007418 [Brassica rapa subsp. trilocularis]|uniref:CCT domain-containing protein n=1 Tax=Brassica rapa subsp. trilocularis TaxID=1813537 RepID=A0ABQ7NJT1_BRACM|nr:hypothetical protein IGI04_029844 [Brassica rapa subsp. trilocularis]KAG5411099.1 hypothetical protein IGI04_007418 [Brassica rapa subsp. trilocularis]
MPISTISSKEELLFFSDPTSLERSIRKEKHTSSIDTTSTTSIDTTFTTSIDTTSTTSIDTSDRATIDSSTRTSIDTNPRADIVATLVLQRDENGDLHDPGGHQCNAAGQKIDGQGTAILEPFAATEDAKVPLQRSLVDLIRFYTNRATQILLLDTPTLAQVTSDYFNRQQHGKIDRQQYGSVDREQQKSSDRQPSMPYRTTEKISQQSTEAPKQEQLTIAEIFFVESVNRRHLQGIDRRHLPGIDRHQTDGYEPVMERHATKEEIPVEKRVKSRKRYITKHLRREVNKEELKGFQKRVKRVPKDMSFEDAYHKYRLGNFFKESREPNKDIELLFNKVSRKPKRTLKKEQDPGKFLISCSIHSHHLPNSLYDI